VPTVYLIDDDDGVRESIHAMLETWDFSVEEFASGEAFLARCNDRLAGCVLLDLDLPGLSGLEVLEQLRSELDNPLPVLLMTGHGDELTKDRAFAAGASAFLEKPFESGVLISMVQLLLG